MKRRLSLAAALLACTCAMAQQPPSRTFAPGPFDRLVVAGAARIELTQGERDQVTIVGDEAVLKNVRLRHENGRLVVTTEDDWKFWNRETIQLRVTMHEISRLSISGASDIIARTPIRTADLRIDISGQGEVRIPQLDARQLRFNIAGAGDGELGGGQVEDLQLNVSGKGKLVADKLKARNGVVNISGVGNADVWVTDDLRVTVSGVGTVNYWGQPRLRQQISAIASVNAKGNK